MGKFGSELIGSMKQAVAHASGRKAPRMRVTKVEITDVKAIRQSLHMSQTSLCRRLSNSTLDAEELGAGTALSRCTGGCLFARNSTPPQRSHGGGRSMKSAGTPRRRACSCRGVREDAELDDGSGQHGHPRRRAAKA